MTSSHYLALLAWLHSAQKKGFISSSVNKAGLSRIGLTTSMLGYIGYQKEETLPTLHTQDPEWSWIQAFTRFFQSDLPGIVLEPASPVYFDGSELELMLYLPLLSEQLVDVSVSNKVQIARIGSQEAVSCLRRRLRGGFPGRGSLPDAELPYFLIDHINYSS